MEVITTIKLLYIIQSKRAFLNNRKATSVYEMQKKIRSQFKWKKNIYIQCQTPIKRNGYRSGLNLANVLQKVSCKSCTIEKKTIKSFLSFAMMTKYRYEYKQIGVFNYVKLKVCEGGRTLNSGNELNTFKLFNNYGRPFPTLAKITRRQMYNT